MQNQTRTVTTRPSTTTTRSSTASNNVLARIRFNADPSSIYYINASYNVVKVKNNQFSIIGKLSTLNSRQYPYMISDQSVQLLVDNQGNIVTRQGKQVGKLSRA